MSARILLRMATKNKNMPEKGSPASSNRCIIFSVVNSLLRDSGMSSCISNLDNLFFSFVSYGMGTVWMTQFK